MMMLVSEKFNRSPVLGKFQFVLYIMDGASHSLLHVEQMVKFSSRKVILSNILSNISMTSETK